MADIERCAECGVRLNQDNAGEESICCDYCASREPDVAFLSRVVPLLGEDPEFDVWLSAQ